MLVRALLGLDQGREAAALLASSLLLLLLVETLLAMWFGQQRSG